jgi:hypothetical protein
MGYSANKAHLVAFFIRFQKIITLKIPPGRGDRGNWWLKDYIICSEDLLYHFREK